ncbi:MAG: aminotransferase class III-fold pyridoxal phosphate-dependent enzyme, partial [Ilumatobacter sp.]
ADASQECERALGHLRDVVVGEGADRVAAIVLESVVGTNGILVPPDGYLDGVRALCDEFGIMMICDEVMAGFGRCGEWFAVNNWGVTPDLITFAKGVNSGYVPLGGVCISDAVAETFDSRVFQGGLTYSGHPLACAAAVESIHIMEDEGVLAHARRLGAEVIGPALADMAEQRGAVGEVRGLGAFWAIELVADRESKAPRAAEDMQRVAAHCKANGVWPFVAGNRVHVVPPCNTDLDDARTGLAVIDEALALLD